jgi:glycosyltransferase involved in cell wall biosynthesis
MLLSLIIPIFKSEKYLCECLDSVVRELREDCEVVLVDDGSPDRSVEIILEHYRPQIESNQFLLIRTDNAGPGAARNVGVNAARGDFIGFLDSDDVLLLGYFDRILSVLQSGTSDLIQFHLKRFSNLASLGKSAMSKSHRYSGKFRLAEVRNEIFGVGKWFPVTRIYKRALLTAQPFVEGVFYEDLLTIPFIFMGDYNITLLGDCLYGYRVNNNGTTANHTKKHAETLLDFFVRICELPESTPMNILKVQVARGLSYFAAELGSELVSTDYIVNKIRNCNHRAEIGTYLKLPDRLLYAMPEAYLWIDKWRVPRGRV